MRPSESVGQTEVEHSQAPAPVTPTPAVDYDAIYDAWKDYMEDDTLGEEEEEGW